MKHSIDIAAVRSDFPILQEKIYGKPLIYFDNAATTQKPACVVEQAAYGYYHGNANIHRGVHYLSRMATERHEEARQAVADFLGAESSSEIIFTRGTTEAVNLVASSFGERFCSEGDELILSVMEHHSNIVPWQLLAERKGLILKIVPVHSNGELDTKAYRSLFSPKTRLVALAHVSNVLGTVNPVAELVATAHAHGAKVLIDGAQAVSHLPVNVREIDADFYAFSGHKIYAPTGIGILYGKAELLNAMPPYQSGGEMIQKVSFEQTTFNELPYKFEAGTPDFIGSTALAEALRYVTRIGLDTIAAHEQELLRYATEQLLRIDKLRIIGTSEHKSGVISFLIEGIHAYDLGMLLDRFGIAIRTGHHCAQPLMDSFGITGTARLSFAMYNTKEEIDFCMAALQKVIEMLKN